MTSLSFSQVPSININSTTSINDNQIKMKELLKIEKKLKKEIEKLIEGDSSKTTKENELKSIISEKENELRKNYLYVINEEYYNNQLAVVGDKIDKLKEDLEIAKADNNRDRLNAYVNDIKKLEKEKKNLEIEKIRKLNPQENNYSWLLPSFNKTYRNAFFEDTYNNSTDETNYLNAFAIVGNPNGITGQSELIADNMKMFRITFGTVISATNDSTLEDETKVEALERLLNGGGNFYLDLTLPLTTTIKGNNDDFANLYAFANIKAASDIKGYGNDIEASTYNTSFGLNCYADISTENRKFNFFIIANSNFYYGCTKDFYENLNIEHTNGFLSGKVTIGVTLLNQFRLSANVLTYGSEPSVRSEKIGFGLQFLPKL